MKKKHTDSLLGVFVYSFVVGCCAKCFHHFENVFLHFFVAFQLISIQERFGCGYCDCQRQQRVR